MSAGKCRLQLLLDPLAEACWNRQIEGQITKLKLVKRQMYGRARLDLLRARLINPSSA